MSGFREALYLHPHLDPRIWGGNRLGRMFGKLLPAGQIIGESWELTDRPEAQSRIVGGPCGGSTLRAVLMALGPEIYGPQLWALKPQRFPLLAKFIDAGQPLSIQVHPDDAVARPFNDRGKTECWVILHAEPDAQIIRGFRPGTTREEYQRAVAANRLSELLNTFTPRAGDVIALPPGMVHALSAGIVLAEIQQNSNLTFRIYDYDRLGLDGKPRTLHLEEALATIRFNTPGDEFAGDLRASTVSPVKALKSGLTLIETLLEGRYFSLERLRLPKGAEYLLPAFPQAPRILMALCGSGTLQERSLPAGQTVLLPASLPPAQIRCATEETLVLLIATVRGC